MSQGRIVERGTHLELLAARGAYAQMWAIQRSHQQNPDGDQGLSTRVVH